MSPVTQYRESSCIFRAFGRECRLFQSACTAPRGSIYETETRLTMEVRLYASFSHNSISSPARIVGKRKQKLPSWFRVCEAKHVQYWKACKIWRTFNSKSKRICYKIIIRSLIENRNSKKISLLWVLT